MSRKGNQTNIYNTNAKNLFIHTFEYLKITIVYAGREISKIRVKNEQNASTRVNETEE